MSNAVLLIFHGSRSPKASELAELSTKKVQEYLSAPDISVDYAFLEYRPSIYDAIDKLECNGLKNIFALPVFINSSVHTIYDIPNILGLSYIPESIEKLKNDKQKIVNSKSSITYGPTISSFTGFNDILLRIAANEYKTKHDAILILAHGSMQFKSKWEIMLNSCRNHIKERLGANYVKYAFIGAGSGFDKAAMPAILEARKYKSRVIVVGCFVAVSARDMFNRYIKKNPKDGSIKYINRPEIIFTDESILPDDELYKWAASLAEDYFYLQKSSE